MPVRFGDVATRLVSAVVMLPPLAAALWQGGLALALLVAAVTGCLAWEWSRMAGAGRPLAAACAAAGCLPVAAWPLLPADDWGWSAAAAGLAVGALAVRHRHGLVVLAGPVVAAVPGVALLWLRGFEPGGTVLVAGLLGCVIATDTGAYAAGRLFGGPRLAPMISPNKTWAGLAGGILAGAAGGGLMAVWLPGHANVALLCLAGAGIAVVSQVGDLGESAMKRRFGVKDSGRMIPGHGGVLDRCDGHMAAISAAAALVLLGGKPPVLW